MAQNLKILIVGVGNTLRGDDGIAAYICQGIGKLEINGVETQVTQQLQVEQVEEFLLYDQVVIVDAANSDEPVRFYALDSKESNPVSSSHHVNAGLLALLSLQLYQRDLPVMVCAVQGKQFDMSEQLSPLAKQNADQAISIITKWIENRSR